MPHESLLKPSSQGLLICTSTRQIWGISYLETEGSLEEKLTQHVEANDPLHLRRIYVSFPGDPFWDIIHAEGAFFRHFNPENELGIWYARDSFPDENSGVYQTAMGEIAERLSADMKARARKVLLPSRGRRNASIKVG